MSSKLLLDFTGQACAFTFREGTLADSDLKTCHVLSDRPYALPRIGTSACTKDMN